MGNATGWFRCQKSGHCDQLFLELQRATQDTPLNTNIDHQNVMGIEFHVRRMLRGLY